LTRPTTITVIARLQDAGDQRAGEQALDGRAGDLGQQRAHAVCGQVADAVGHELQAEHEQAQAADHRHQDLLEQIDLHALRPCVLLFDEGNRPYRRCVTGW
jgi:hypothetical protein